MRILFDHQVFSWQTYGGISRYFAEQIRGLKALDQTVLLPDHFYSENVYLRGFPEFQRKSLSPIAFKGKKFLQNRLGRRSSLKAIREKAPQVFHPTYFDLYYLKTLKKREIPLVITVHDMIHEIYGHGSQSIFSLDAQVVENKRILTQKAAAVIAVSENTRLDLLRFCPEIDPAKIHVIHHGNGLAPRQSAPLVSESPYLLFVGQRKSYKHFSWMVTQLADLLRTEKDLQLICVGGSAFDEQERAQFTALGLTNKIRYRVVSSDEELADVYHQAVCFIFPSQYEGFGIPVLEAFACNCPAVLNRASSLPEVGGDAAVYFEENRPETLETAVRSILENAVYRETLISKGIARAKQFTWGHSAAKHLAVYQSITQ